MITVVIPSRKDETQELTLKSLAKQTFKDFTIVVSLDTESKGANYARNKGFEKVFTKYVLFSDNDIDWQPNALQIMFDCLERKPEVSYCFGMYEGEGLVRQCTHQFKAEYLRRCNIASTMSLLRTEDFCEFDENIHRLQDWDLWLTLLSQGKTGYNCGEVLFYTPKRDGITFGEKVKHAEAVDIIRKKHNIQEWEWKDDI